MTGKELIELITKNELEDFDISVIFTDGYNVYPNIRNIELRGLADIGHGSRVAYLDGVGNDG